MEYLKAWNLYFIILIFILFTLEGRLFIEIDRRYLIGSHGYNSLVDFDLLTSNFTMPPNKHENSNFLSRTGFRNDSRKNRHGFYRINTIKYSGTDGDSFENLPFKRKSDNPNTGITSSVNNNVGINGKKILSKSRNNLERAENNSNLDHRDINLDKFFYEVPVIERPEIPRKLEGRLPQRNLAKNSKTLEYIHKVSSGRNNPRNFDVKNGDKTVTNFGKEIDEPKLFSEPDVSAGRFLSIFEVVNFNNVECLSGSGLKGTCLHPLECSAASGSESGDCADGYGICCVFQYSCGDQTSANCSTFTNPGYPRPSQDRLSCTLTVHKAHPGITQIMLDIVQMELQPPTNGTCVEDQFVITGQNINSVIPILCGINNDQQMYVEVGDSPGPFYISVLSSQPAARLLQVGVCQSAGGAAPPGCLQYYRGAEGLFESFNYRGSGSLPGLRAPGYFNNLNYAICIERALGTCSITYTNADDNGEFEFQISNYDSDGVPLLPPGQAGAEIFNCPDDFIVVNGIRLCGERLNDASLTEDFTTNAPVTELGAGPIVFIFRTNGNVTGRGFRLSYKQNTCASPD